MRISWKQMGIIETPRMSACKANSKGKAMDTMVKDRKRLPLDIIIFLWKLELMAMLKHDGKTTMPAASM